MVNLFYFPMELVIISNINIGNSVLHDARYDLCMNAFENDIIEVGIMYVE
jgi:hypothetical protein